MSPMIRYNILNVLYAYAYTVRFYNGDHHDLALDATQVMNYIPLPLSQLHTPGTLLQTVLDISSCLAGNASYSMVGEAITHAVTTVQQVQHPPFSLSQARGWRTHIYTYPRFCLVFCFYVSEIGLSINNTLFVFVSLDSPFGQQF